MIYIYSWSEPPFVILCGTETMFIIMITHYYLSFTAFTLFPLYIVLLLLLLLLFLIYILIFLKYYYHKYTHIERYRYLQVPSCTHPYANNIKYLIVYSVYSLYYTHLYTKVHISEPHDPYFSSVCRGKKKKHKLRAGSVIRWLLRGELEQSSCTNRRLESSRSSGQLAAGW